MALRLCDRDRVDDAIAFRGHRDCGERQVKDAHVGVISNQGGIMTTHATLVLRNY